MTTDHKDTSQEKATRRFSKRITVASLAALFGLAGYGTYVQYPQTADVIDSLGPWVLGLIVVYMGVGHLDFRAVLGQSFGDVLTTLLRRRRPAANPYDATTGLD
jgi:hypothetical protein